jgi:hypothetical protein
MFGRIIAVRREARQKSFSVKRLVAARFSRLGTLNALRESITSVSNTEVTRRCSCERFLQSPEVFR